MILKLRRSYQMTSADATAALAVSTALTEGSNGGGAGGRCTTDGEGSGLQEDQLASVDSISPREQHQQDDDKKHRQGGRRRKLGPSMSILRKLSKRRSTSCHDEPESSKSDNNNRSDFAFMSDQNILLEGPVQLTTSLQTQNRYAFLYSDTLILTKQKSSSNYRLKQRVRVCELWLAECIDEVSEVVHPPERSFVIGWPTTNVVATFDKAETRNIWLNKLTECIAVAKDREVPPSVLLKVINRDKTFTITKTLLVGNNEEALDVTRRCVQEFHISENSSDDYQLWVLHDNKHESPYPLIGHEHPYSIRMNYLRNRQSLSRGRVATPSGRTAPVCENDPIKGVKFQIKPSRIVRQLSLESDKSDKSPPTKKVSPIAKLLKLTSRDRRQVFGRELSELWQNNDRFSYPIMPMLTQLFTHGPSTAGIFRKSASYSKCREVKAQLDAGHEFNFDTVSVLVTASLLKEFLRCLPDCLLVSRLYTQWIDVALVSDRALRREETSRMLLELPPCNQHLLRHLVCILRHITDRSAENQMTSYNLSVCIGHCLLWAPAPATGAMAVGRLEDAYKVNLLVRQIIDDAAEIFGDECLLLFGDVRQMETAEGTEQAIPRVASADSDSLVSYNAAGIEDSLLSGMERDLYPSDVDSSRGLNSARGARHNNDLHNGQFSMTSISYDSGLTSSNPQLYEDISSSTTTIPEHAIASDVVICRPVPGRMAVNSRNSMLDATHSTPAFNTAALDAILRPSEKGGWRTKDCLPSAKNKKLNLMRLFSWSAPSTPVGSTPVCKTPNSADSETSSGFFACAVPPVVVISTEEITERNEAVTNVIKNEESDFDVSVTDVIKILEVTSMEGDQNVQKANLHHIDDFNMQSEDYFTHKDDDTDVCDPNRLFVSHPTGLCTSSLSPSIHTDLEQQLSLDSGVSVTPEFSESNRKSMLDASRQALSGQFSNDDGIVLNQQSIDISSPSYNESFSLIHAMANRSPDTQSMSRAPSSQEKIRWWTDRSRKMLTRTKAVDRSSSSVLGVVHPSGMTDTGADVFPSRLTVDSMDHVTMVNLTTDVERAGGSPVRRTQSSPVRGQDHGEAELFRLRSQSPEFARNGAISSRRSPSPGELLLPQQSWAVHPSQPSPTHLSAAKRSSLRPKRPPTYEEALVHKAMLQGNLSTLERRQKKSALATLLYDNPSVDTLQDHTSLPNAEEMPCNSTKATEHFSSISIDSSRSVSESRSALNLPPYYEQGHTLVIGDGESNLGHDLLNKRAVSARLGCNFVKAETIKNLDSSIFSANNEMSMQNQDCIDQDNQSVLTVSRILRNGVETVSSLIPATDTRNDTYSGRSTVVSLPRVIKCPGKAVSDIPAFEKASRFVSSERVTRRKHPGRPRQRLSDPKGIATEQKSAKLARSKSDSSAMLQQRRNRAGGEQTSTIFDYNNKENICNDSDCRAFALLATRLPATERTQTFLYESPKKNILSLADSNRSRSVFKDTDVTPIRSESRSEKSRSDSKRRRSLTVKDHDWHIELAEQYSSPVALQAKNNSTPESLATTRQHDERTKYGKPIDEKTTKDSTDCRSSAQKSHNVDCPRSLNTALTVGRRQLDPLKYIKPSKPDYAPSYFTTYIGSANSLAKTSAQQTVRSPARDHQNTPLSPIKTFQYTGKSPLKDIQQTPRSLVPMKAIHHVDTRWNVSKCESAEKCRPAAEADSSYVDSYISEHRLPYHTSVINESRQRLSMYERATQQDKPQLSLSSPNRFNSFNSGTASTLSMRPSSENRRIFTSPAKRTSILPSPKLSPQRPTSSSTSYLSADIRTGYVAASPSSHCSPSQPSGYIPLTIRSACKSSEFDNVSWSVARLKETYCCDRSPTSSSTILATGSLFHSQCSH